MSRRVAPRSRVPRSSLIRAVYFVELLLLLLSGRWREHVHTELLVALKSAEPAPPGPLLVGHAPSKCNSQGGWAGSETGWGLVAGRHMCLSGDHEAGLRRRWESRYRVGLRHLEVELSRLLGFRDHAGDNLRWWGRGTSQHQLVFRVRVLLAAFAVAEFVVWGCVGWSDVATNVAGAAPRWGEHVCAGREHSGVRNDGRRCTA